MTNQKIKFHIDLEKKTLGLNRDSYLKLDKSIYSAELSFVEKERMVTLHYHGHVAEEEMDKIDAYLRERGINDEKIHIGGHNYPNPPAKADVIIIGNIQTNLGEGRNLFR